MSNLRLDLLTDEELIEYQTLLAQVEIDNRWKDLRNPQNGGVNPNYKFVFDAYYNQKYNKEQELESGYRGVVLEGSSRSGKTYSVIMFLIKCCIDSDIPLVINIYRVTYNSFKSTLYKDFESIYPLLGIEDNKFRFLQEVKEVKINKSKIYFLGGDNVENAMGNQADIVYINEAIQIDYDFYKEAVRRNKFFILDYNPTATEHWIYDKVLKRSDVGFLRTTFNDNPFLNIQSKLEILNKEPFLPNSYEIIGNKEIWYNGKPIDETNQPPPHPTNVDEGTADLQDWMVMGLGLRYSREGAIFKNVRFGVDKSEIPYDLAYSYGLDFGFTIDPTVLTRNWENETDIYIEVLSYHPIDNEDDLVKLFEGLDIEYDVPITCDSIDKHTSEGGGTIQMVMALQDAGYDAYKVSKTKGVWYWLMKMNKKRINFIKNDLDKHAKIETENYKQKVVDGRPLNQPIDKWNHIWDSSRYRFMAFNDDLEVETEWN